MRHLLLLPLLAVAGLAHGQKKTKTPPPPPLKPLTHAVYDSWKSITYRTLSNDGAWAVYTANPQEGDGAAIVYGLKKPSTDSLRRAAEIRLGFGSDFVFYKIKPPFALVQDAKRKKKKKEDMPKDSLGIYTLGSGKIEKIANVPSFKIPEKAGGFLAYQVETAVRKDTARKAAKPRKKESDENGYRLVVRNTVTGVQSVYPYVTEYELSKNGKRLAFVSTGNDSTQKIPSVQVVDLATGQSRKIYEAKGKSRKLTFDETGDQLAFVTDPDTNAKSLVRYHKLYYWKDGEAQARKAADETGQKTGWLVSGDAPVSFAKDGSKLFFGVAPKPAVADTTLLPEEVVQVEVWSHSDQHLQPQQKVTLEQDRKRAYTAVWDPATGRQVTLGSPTLPDIFPANEGRADYVLAASDTAYSHAHWDWNPHADVYLLSTKDGSARPVGKNIVGNVRLSPEGRYAYWFSLPDTAWFAWSVQSGKTIQLTKGRAFADEDDDHPDYPHAYGIAGWTRGDEQLYLYDRYDIWAVTPGSEPVRLTSGRGEKKSYRYIRLDPEERFIDTTKPLLLRQFSDPTKATGYATLSNGQLSVLYQGDFDVSDYVVKAKNTNDILFIRSTFREYPDLLAADLTFKAPKKISALGDQMKPYRWGSVELVHWISGDGQPLDGLFYKPDGFDPSKKYPMITYFYEKESMNLHLFATPGPVSSARNNYAYSVSNGYLVFVPDIVYRDGYPGQSAYSCIIPGVLKLLENSWVDRDRLGIVGHSWGGYQTAYLITQTHLFKTSVPGAPVANMSSAYGGIRWGTGMSRQAQYEHTQSRIGGTLWEKPLNFIENSPLFFLPNVKTPALILHNDDDDAVPWYQGIELYMGLKRLGKPAWMINYNGEKHGNRLRKNQKDWTIRMWQYLDYYLKDAPAPKWMADGLPMVEKGINQRLEPAGR